MTLCWRDEHELQEREKQLEAKEGRVAEALNLDTGIAHRFGSVLLRTYGWCAENGAEGLPIAFIAIGSFVILCIYIVFVLLADFRRHRSQQHSDL